jgi:hypothetical protein
MGFWLGALIFVHCCRSVIYFCQLKTVENFNKMVLRKMRNGFLRFEIGGTEATTTKSAIENRISSYLSPISHSKLNSSTMGALEQLMEMGFPKDKA